MQGTLYLCATPIGNLEDMTFRAVRILREADLIAAEDTRNSIKLLSHFEIRTPMTSYHEYNKIEKGKKLTALLLEGVKGANPRMTVEPPLVVYNKDGTYTDELLELYGLDRQGR